MVTNFTCGEVPASVLKPTVPELYAMSPVKLAVRSRMST